MSSFKKTFGERLKQIRKLNNFTQEKLAESIGINLRQLARIEAGESFVTAETLEQICYILNISPSVLFDFPIINDTKMTASGETVHFNVVKEGNVIHLVNKETFVKSKEKNKSKNSMAGNIDDKMIKLAIKLNKDITVDEYEDGIIVVTKIFKPDGKVEFLQQNTTEQDILALKKKIDSFSQDTKKISFINLAIDALSDSSSRQQLKMIIEGMDLMQ